VCRSDLSRGKKLLKSNQNKSAGPADAPVRSRSTATIEFDLKKKKKNCKKISAQTLHTMMM
jgi:hypothetical protein